ncbi:hypothetical protein [Pedobacter sp. CFBP9032]|uniref:hypothetical protein n=1 Tax=Pedobacter sp. CFBP9032 TaxID=3096539 RepID=UPI002A69C333|nr:hypothetical protein [Pedobacter sp. CFBP9032]MDY0903897.1 hypothetical protein [Pedobacter sp. CFBP9032]
MLDKRFENLISAAQVLPKNVRDKLMKDRQMCAALVRVGFESLWGGFSNASPSIIS